MKAMPAKTRTYTMDNRHLIPMMRDFLELITMGLLKRKSRASVIQVGRDIRQRAFDQRDPLPILEHRDIAAFLGCSDPQPIILPPVDLISLAGLGFVVPYTLLATIVSALQPKKIFETGTFRGVGALTMLLNAPNAEIYTVDLPDEETGADVAGLSRGDKEWVRLGQGCKGIAFQGHPQASRVHQIFADSLKLNATEFISNADFCFIDGGHSYECIRADTENALKVLSPNGVIVWDDYTWFTEGVSEYLLELGKTLPLQHIAGSYFVIYKREA